jgi:hypothetical protein
MASFPSGNCLAGNICNNNGSGPVCGICSQSGVMTTQGCKECPPEELIGPLRNMAMALSSFAFLILWLWYSWSPFFPSIVEHFGNCFCLLCKSRNTAEGSSFMIVVLYKIVSKINDVLEFAKTRNLVQYFKIFVGYFQITSSFLSFQVNWPATLVSAMMWLKATINLSVLSLPGISCLWRTISFRRKLVVYTISPLVLIVLLALPSGFAYFRIWCTHAGGDFCHIDSQQRRYVATLDRFWNAVMFIAFMMYPLVCLVTLEPFNCQPNGLGLLSTDRRESCPEALSFDRIWASIFLMLYPFGVPIASILVLRSMGVHRLAAEKIDAAIITAMINLFIKRTTSIESQRIAQVIGPIGQDMNDFRRRARELYKFLWPPSTLDVTESQVKSLGIHKLMVHIKHARGLPKMDRFGAIDPFCTISFAGKFERTTTKQKTYDPLWNDEYFEFDVDEICLGSEDLLTMKIKVMDWDRLGKNKLVGEVEIHPEKVKSILNSEVGWCELFDLEVRILGDRPHGDTSLNEDLPITTPSFRLQFEVHHLDCSMVGSEISKLKEFAAKYDTDQVIFGQTCLYVSIYKA